MKKIDEIEYFTIADISQIFKNKVKQEEISKYFEEGKIEGQIINDEWYATQEAIDDFIKNIFLKERSYSVGPYEIDLSNVKLEGKILDIGGGGEGIISQYKGIHVVAIDPNENELEETPESEALKIVMDAKDLKFLPSSFDTVTSFFTLMYVPKDDHEIIFREIYRVLKLNGEFVIWDVIIPNRANNDKNFFFIKLSVKFNDIKRETGYVVQWNKEQDISYYSNLAKKIGFQVLETKIAKKAFFMRIRKT